MKMRSFDWRGTLDMMKYFGVVFGIVGGLVLILYFNFNFIDSTYKAPFITMASPDKSYIAKIYRESKPSLKDSYVSVSIYDNRNRLVKKNLFKQYYCKSITLHWNADNTVIINELTLDVKQKAVLFKKENQHPCPANSLIY